MRGRRGVALPNDRDRRRLLDRQRGSATILVVAIVAAAAPAVRRYSIDEHLTRDEALARGLVSRYGTLALGDDQLSRREHRRREQSELERFPAPCAGAAQRILSRRARSLGAVATATAAIFPSRSRRGGDAHVTDAFLRSLRGRFLELVDEPARGHPRPARIWPRACCRRAVHSCPL